MSRTLQLLQRLYDNNVTERERKEFAVKVMKDYEEVVNNLSKTNRILDECQKEIKTLKQENENLKSFKITEYQKGLLNLQFYDNYRKYKSIIDKIEQYVSNKIDYLNNGIFLVDGQYVDGALQILKELKEVLENDK